MTGYLLDTHALLWSLFDPDKLGSESRAVLSNAETLVYVSSISFWEISLKSAIGKLALDGCQPEEMPAICEQLGYKTLALSPQQAASFHRLPKFGHKDPFDRMLIWQAIQENLVLISKDEQFHSYQSLGLQTCW